MTVKSLMGNSDNYPYCPTSRDWDTVLHGDPANPKRGGHLSGVGRERKTETDSTWGEERVMDAIRRTIAEPDKLIVMGTTLVRLKEVDSVIFSVATYPDGRGGYRLAHAYPVVMG